MLRRCYFWISCLQCDGFWWIQGRLGLRCLLYRMGRNIFIYPSTNQSQTILSLFYFRFFLFSSSPSFKSFIFCQYNNFYPYFLKLQILICTHPSPVTQQLSLKYDSFFFAHFANPINELIYDNVYTEYRVSTKDFLCGVSDIEYIMAFLPYEDKKYEALIWFNAELFESPLRITCEMPLMILTDTKEIFERRKKRFRKLLNNDISSSDSQSSSVSSIFTHSTVVVLDQSASDITFMNLSSSGCGSLSSGSCFNVFAGPSEVSREGSSGREESDVEMLSIRELVANELRHLIVQFNSRSSTEVVESVRSRRDPHFQDFSQQVKDYDPNEARPPSTFSQEIQSVVKAELKKYNIGPMMQLSSLNSSSRQSKSKMKVREKAEQLLRTMRLNSVI